MNHEYLLLIALGPVQTFIAAARRCRDLWSGSWLLSEISKAAAAALRENGAQLIFPAPDRPDSDLAPDSALSVGNKLQAIVFSGNAQGPENLARIAGEAARRRFCDIAGQARGNLPLRDEVWRHQIGDYVEHYAAWARIVDGDYGRAAAAANAALAARKVTRDFRPAAIRAEEAPAYGLPKSSLDGARETVLPENDGISRNTRRRLGLSQSEQLDCAGIAKRLGGNPEQFTPFSRISAHAWIENLSSQERKQLAEAHEPLVSLELTTRVKGNDGCYRDFPYDAQLLYRARLDAALRDARKDADDEAIVALEKLRDTARPIWKKHGEPCSYGVILLADGDRMGALLNEIQHRNGHIAITRALSSFASRVPALLRESSGHAIYAGGDDVLAFLPLHTALSAANCLRREFADILQPRAEALNAVNRPTLSAGLAIGHFMEPLGNLRDLAKQAEIIAKGETYPEAQKRNALGIALRIRSGGLITLRLHWDDWNAHKAFEGWQNAYRTAALPSRLAYDARQIHQRTAFALEGDDPEQGQGIQRAEFNRLLQRARTGKGEKLSEDWQEKLRARLEFLLERHRQSALAKLADELIVSRWLAAHGARDLGEPS
ncbi:MAG: type III-B CRISPR-associated protein Cas10/Cmr2 [Zoogloeaceae bacterium]|jgi:CRISPR-associated protein Cmr2|nr:type III-B CRISPR-associated protein Cas10/Cmr2 [Zoogloeaceae bacterium]